MLVKPLSRSSLALAAVLSVCSSGGIMPSWNGIETPVKEGWQWPSTMPGISVMPWPSMVGRRLLARDLVAALGHRADPVALDQHLARETDRHRTRPAP